MINMHSGFTNRPARARLQPASQRRSRGSQLLCALALSALWTVAGGSTAGAQPASATAQAQPLPLPLPQSQPAADIDYHQLADQQLISFPAAAINNLDLAIARDGDYAEAYALRAVAYNRTMVPQQADDDIKRAMAMAPASPVVLGARAAIALDRKQYGPAAEDAYRAVQLAPDFYIGHSIYTSALLKLNRYPEAVAHLESLIAATPADPWAYGLLVNLYREHGDEDKRMDTLNRGVAAAPNTAMYMVRAQTRAAADREGRMRDYAAALQLADNPVWVMRDQAILELDAGRNEDAIPILDAAIGQAGGSDVVALLKTLRAVAYVKTGQTQLADADLASARTIITNPDQMNSIAWILATRNAALPVAQSMVDAALTIGPTSAPFLDTSGIILLRSERYVEAIRQFDAALAIEPRQAGSLFARGIARRRLGQTAAGDADLGAARAVNPAIDTEYVRYGITL